MLRYNVFITYVLITAIYVIWSQTIEIMVFFLLDLTLFVSIEGYPRWDVRREMEVKNVKQNKVISLVSSPSWKSIVSDRQFQIEKIDP